MLSTSRPANDHFYEMTLASSLPREEADRLSESVKQSTDEQAQLIAESTDKWRVVIQKETTAQVEETRAKLDDAGFEVVSVKDTQKQSASNTAAKTPMPTSPPSAASKLKYTARAASPTRELVAFARGSAPSIRSSAPLLFASSDEKNGPVRFNDKP
jgi:hypothetical protein